MHKSTYTFRNNNKFLLQQLIHDGININLFFKDKTALYMAILFNSLTCVEILINLKVDIHFVNKNKWTPLHIAARKNEHIVKLLVNAGAEVNAETCEGETPLHFAASVGDIKTIQHLVAAGGLINSQDKNGDSVLMKATKRSSNVKEICTYLVKSGANVNLQNTFGVQPIVSIVYIDCLELMQLFIEHGADVNACDSMGRSILSLAIWRRKREITNLLLLSGADVNYMFKGEVPLLVMAVKLGDVKLVKTMLEMGADVTKADINGNTPLHVAVDEIKFRQSRKYCLENRDEIQCVFVKEGVNLHWKNRETPLHLAASGPEEIVKMLIDAGADVNAEIQLSDLTVECDFDNEASGSRQSIHNDKQLRKSIGPNITTLFGYSETPMHINVRKSTSVLFKAIESKSIEKIMYLVKVGANVNVPDKHGVLPIVNILQFDNIELVKQFVNHGADVTSCDKEHNSLLCIALNRKCKDIAMFLVDKGADVNVLYGGQVPALSMAVMLDDVALVKTMIKHGADVTKSDMYGNTPLHIALFLGIDNVTSVKYMPYFIRDEDKYLSQLLKPKKLSILSCGSVIHPLDTIDMCKQSELVEVLIEAGAKVNQKNNDLESPVHTAVKVYNLREKYYSTLTGDRYTKILTLLINHGAKLSNSILYFCILNRHIDHVGGLLKNSRYYFVDENLRKHLPNIPLSQLESIFAKRQFETLQIFVYNGIVFGETQKTISGETISLTSLMLAIMYRQVNLTKFLLATGYMTVEDLRQLRQLDKSPEELNNILCEKDKQPIVSTYELQSLIHEAVSQPWPLVKLAFITVSTMLGEGPERDKRLSQTNLPPKLKQSLNFESPVSFLPVSEWSKIQLCFDPVVYETLPRPRPLLYYWPTGLETPMAHITLSEGSNIPQFLETALDYATLEYSLKCWSLDASHVYMKCRLTRLKQYTENQNEKLSIHQERHLAEVVMKAAYDIRHRQQRLDDKQREELDPLVECCVDSLNACIYYHSTSFDADYGPEYLVLRSGLQFMIEDFESLEFEYDDEDSDFKENITSFTECLETWKKRFGLSDFFNNITHTAEELRRPEGIPAEHTWWF